MSADECVHKYVAFNLDIVVGCNVEMTTKASSGKWPLAAGGSQFLGLQLLFKDKLSFILLSDINTL